MNLRQAVENVQPDTVSSLLKSGANPFEVGADGQSPIEILASHPTWRGLMGEQSPGLGQACQRAVQEMAQSVPQTDIEREALKSAGLMAVTQSAKSARVFQRAAIESVDPQMEARLETIAQGAQSMQQTLFNSPAWGSLQARPEAELNQLMKRYQDAVTLGNQQGAQEADALLTKPASSPLFPSAPPRVGSGVAVQEPIAPAPSNADSASVRWGQSATQDNQDDVVDRNLASALPKIGGPKSGGSKSWVSDLLARRQDKPSAASSPSIP